MGRILENEISRIREVQRHRERDKHIRRQKETDRRREKRISKATTRSSKWET